MLGLLQRSVPQHARLRPLGKAHLQLDQRLHPRELLQLLSRDACAPRVACDALGDPRKRRLPDDAAEEALAQRQLLLGPPVALQLRRVANVLAVAETYRQRAE